MQEKDVETFMRQEWTMTSTDGSLSTAQGAFHPRGNGTYARKIRRYVLERETITLAHAIHSMTGLPSSVFRLEDRGIIREGAAADIVVFDLERIADRATYLEPQHLSDGMVYVLVNGELAVEEGRFTENLAGQVLSRN